MTQQTQHIRVAIIGSGFGGLGAAIRLKQEGEEDFLVFERAEEVGGVWRDNRYPGCACDVQSHLYSFSFAPNPYWTRRFSPQPEIWSYLQRCAEEFGVMPYLRFNHEVKDAAWLETEARWRIQTSQGVYTADLLVAAAGALSEPRIPPLPGLDAFEGLAIHSARWPANLNLVGQRVAVVGTGASAIQIIPAIQPQVGRLTVFQRTPPWIMPRHDRALSRGIGQALDRLPWLRLAARARLYLERELLGLPFRHLWLARLAERGARRHLQRQVADPALRARLIPNYTFGCKRVLLSDDYYPALTQPNVELVDGPVVEVRPRGVVGADGVERPVDVIVFGTGFQVTEFPFARRIRGRGGVRLADAFGPSPKAHVGTTVVGFPNLFILQGPNTGLGHTSVILMIEAQIEHFIHALRALGARRSQGVVAVEPRPEAQAAFVAEVDRQMAQTVWTAGGCRSWYLDATGRNSTLWPSSVGSFKQRVEPFHAGEYNFLSAPPRPSAVDAGAPQSELPLPLRLRGALARWLGSLPPGLQAWLSGRPAVEVDGQTLDPTLQLFMGLRPQGDRRPLTAGSPEQARLRHRREILALRQTATPVGAVRDLTVEGADGPLAARLYTPPNDRASTGPLLVYYHGGGFVVGDLDTVDEACRLLCLDGHQRVLSVAYRLAPEHAYPAALDDAEAAFRWAQAHAAELGVSANRIAVGGDSAGGNLAAAVAQRTRWENPPLAQLLIYPSVDRATPRPSEALFDGFFLTVADRDAFSDYYYRVVGVSDADPGVSPLLASDLSGLPPALVVTAGFDILRDEGAAYAYALQAAGARCLLQRESSLAHGFIQLTSASRACHDATVRLARSWRAFLMETHCP